MNELDSIKFWADLGFSSAISGLTIYLLFKYVPRLVESHLEFVKVSKEQSTRILALQEDFSSEFQGHVMEAKCTVQAIKRGCDILDILAENEDRIKFHTEEIRRILG